MEFQRPRLWVTSLVILAATLCGLSWALASPVGSSPDDDYHLASIWCPTPTACERSVDKLGRVVAKVPAALVVAACPAFRPEVSAACQSPPPEGKEWAHIDTGEYPGVFYRVLHIFASDQHTSLSVVAMRTANVMVSICLAAALALVNGARVRRLLAYSVAASVVPLGLFIIASTNPSSWAVTGVATTFFGLFGMVHSGNRRTRIINGALAFVGSCLAAGARGDAGIFVAGTVVMVAIQGGRAARRSLSFLVTGGLITVTGLASALRAAQVSADRTSPAADSLAYAITNSVFNVPGFLFGAWGSWALGWLDTSMPAGVTVAAGLVGGGLLFLGLGRKDIPTGIAFAGVVASFLMIPTLMLLSVHYTYGSWVQPRYVLPLVPLLFGTVLVLSQRGQVARLQPLAAAAMAFLLAYANSAALFTVLARYTMGATAKSLLGEHQWWWPLPLGPRAVWFIGSLAFALAAWSIVLTSRSASPSDSDNIDPPAQQFPESDTARRRPVDRPVANAVMPIEQSARTALSVEPSPTAPSPTPPAVGSH